MEPVIWLSMESIWKVLVLNLISRYLSICVLPQERIFNLRGQKMKWYD